VAHNTALKAKAMNRKRRTKEREAGAFPRREACDETGRQLQAVLDAELSHLPDKYRVPIVLCDLEGKTIKEAARQLGWPQGTVASRLSRGRVLLTQRVARRGLALSSVALGATLARAAAPAGVPVPLLVSTLKAASFVGAGRAPAADVISGKVAALTEGVIRAMFVTKMKITTAVLLVLATVGLGVVGLVYQTRGAQPDSRQQPAQAPHPIDVDGFDPHQTAKAAPAPVPEAEGKHLAAPREDLLKTRVEAAQRAYELIWHHYQVGQHDEETVYRWSLRWLSARQQASAKKADQVAALKEHLQRMRHLEKQAPTRPIIVNDLRNVPDALHNPLKKTDLIVTKDGKVSSVEVSTRPDHESAAVTRFFRVEAEIWLAEAEQK
jgi:hypothetical protein